MNILFVCKGNIGRSQMAEALFNDLTTGHEARSAGTIVREEGGHGQKLKDILYAGNVILSLRERGIEVGEQVRTQVEPELIDWADTIIVMAEPETIPDYLAASPKAVYWEVKNPKGMTLEDHRERVKQLEALVNELIEKIS